MPSNRFPIVGDNTLFGEAARLATRAKVGAVLVVSTNGLSLLPIKALPGQETGKINDIMAVQGIPLSSLGVSALDLVLKGVHGDKAEISFSGENYAHLGVVVGYKECTVNSAHIYTASYPKSDCPHKDTGKLVLKRV